MLQGFDRDDSDEEWEVEIREEFGVRGGHFTQNSGRPMDVGMDIRGLVQHTFHIYDGLASRVGNVDDVVGGESIYEDRQEEAGDEAATGGAQQQEETTGEPDLPNQTDHARTREEQLDDDDLAAMEQLTPTQQQILEESARTPLYAGSGLTQLGGTLLLLNCLRTHGASNVLVNEVFGILSKSLLPKINSLPPNEYHASKVLKNLGLAYETIHCCPGPKACVLFRGEEFKDLLECPRCGAQRYKEVGKSRVPVKVLRHFPLIPRLQRMFNTPVLASFMTWHQHHRSEDDVMRGAVDSYQWRFVNSRWREEFAYEPRNLRLGLATDGVNPFSVKRSTWSTWPVLIMNYNLPPWMTTKKHFMMLSLIIPGKKSVTGEDFDVYLEPLLEELQILWGTGVPTDDAAMYMGSPRFNMKAILLWTIRDFPAYGIVSGCVTKGYVGCPICGPNTISRRSRSLHKNVYDAQYRRFLPCGHPWRAASHAWDGVAETRGPPPKVTAAEVIRWGQLRESWVSLGATPASEDPARRFGIKRVSSLFNLPYWKVRHVITSPVHPYSPLIESLHYCQPLYSYFRDYPRRLTQSG